MTNDSNTGTSAQDPRTEHEQWLARAAQISDEEFLARIKAWDARHPEIAARLTPEQRGY